MPLAGQCYDNMAAESWSAFHLDGDGLITFR
jgi:hypothetical protein